MKAQQLARASRTVREATARRDSLIRQLHDEGASLRQIAEAAGLSHTAIAKILRRGGS